VNLIGNAVKFTSAGEVRVRLESESEREQITFHVTDTGPGITAEQLARLFRPFSQADVSTTRQFGGTGLGLSISRSLARLLGGDVHVRTATGEGSTFSLTAATGPTAGIPLITSLEKVRSRIEPVVTEGELPRIGGRVLLVEDGVDNQRLLSVILRRAGADVVVVANGKEGVEAVASSQQEGAPFGVVLMDMQMPVMDGYTATRLLRERGYLGQIIALTAHAMKGELSKCLDAGCDHYLSKPISRHVLVREVALRMGKPSARSPNAPIAAARPASQK
jgi:Amt family ammonium transporter